MVLHKLRVTTWVFSLLVDVNVYIEPIRRGCSVFCKIEYKGTQQDLHQILHTCIVSRRVGGVIAASQL